MGRAVGLPSLGFAYDAGSLTQGWCARLNLLHSLLVCCVLLPCTGSTQQHWPFPTSHIELGYAYILTHPGVPCLFIGERCDARPDRWAGPAQGCRVVGRTLDLGSCVASAQGSL